MVGVPGSRQVAGRVRRVGSSGGNDGRMDPHPTTAAQAAPVIEAVGLVKRWGSTPVLEDATFAVSHGVTGLLGANGAGKTTLIGMILGLHRADEGTLRTFGLDAWGAGSEIRSRLGYSPEHHLLPPDMRAHDFVRHLAEVHGLPGREATARASESLYHVGLGEERFRPLGTMSTGQRQRVKLAQAIVHDPRLVLLDEPTDGLDPVQRDDMLALIRRIGTDFGIDVVLSSHLLEEIERVCDHAVILGQGRVMASGRLDELTGATGALVVELDGDPTALTEALRRLDITVAVDGRVLHLTADPSIDLARAVRDLLADSDIGLRRLHRGRRSLEDLFFDLEPA
jgi:ABC-2 type transport system ATP-binding protein